MKRTAMKRSRPRPALPPAPRARLTERSGGVCEAQLAVCTGRATDACHRISRKAGGRPNGEDARLSNLWHGCRTCHRWATANPEKAYDLGLAQQEWQDTRVEPMAYRALGWVLLDDDGGVRSFGDAA